MKKTLYILTLTLSQLIFLSKAYGQFSSPNLIDTNTTTITNIITTDINNDNLKDIIITRKFSTSIISYYLNQGNSTFDTEIVIEPGNNQFTNIVSGDFNNDGWTDIVSIGDASNSIILYTNNSASFTAQTIDSFSFFDSDLEVVDIDNDSDLDVVAIGGSTFKVYYNDGFANFTAQTIPGPIEDFFDLAIGDIDSDGFQDIITGGANISVYKNTNGVISYDSVRTNTIPSTFNLFLRLADLDNDGDLDLFSEDDNSNGVRWMANDGNGNFSNLQMIDISTHNIRAGAIKDFDDDGDLDLILSSNFNVVLYTNDGLGNFSSPTIISQGLPTTPITVLHSDDINNDGLFDIIWSADLSFQLNNTIPLSVDKYQMDESIKVYPNPASNQLSINIKTAGTLTIYNSLGQKIDEDIKLVEGRNNLELNLSPKFYFLEIETQSNTIIKRILIE